MVLSYRRVLLMKWEADRNLQLRMALTVAFVLALPFGFAYAILFLLNTVGVGLLEMLTAEPQDGEFYAHPGVLAAGVVVCFALQYALGKRMALRSLRLYDAHPKDYPDLNAAVTRLSAQLDLPAPTVAIRRTAVPNAFTLGRSPENTTVVVTEGLLDRLDDDEIEAVLAHELSHVKNRDVTVMTLALFLPTVTYSLATTGFSIIETILLEFDSGSKGHGVALLVALLTAVFTFTIAVPFWIGSFLFLRLLSRYREFAADRGAAGLTGNPLALATALRKLDDAMTELPDQDVRQRDGGLEALYVAPIEASQFGSDRELIGADVFPETHPPTEERIERLQEIDAAFESH